MNVPIAKAMLDAQATLMARAVESRAQFAHSPAALDALDAMDREAARIVSGWQAAGVTKDEAAARVASFGAGLHALAEHVNPEDRR